MEMRNLGRSGLRVSAVGIGCNNFGQRADLEKTKEVVHAALDAGINFFDTADIYSFGQSEEYLGEVLGPKRNEIVLASKFGMAFAQGDDWKGGSRRYVMKAVEASLRRLKTDHIDLYQLHQVDPLTPIEETLRALDDLVRQGKVRYIGCSNLPAWQMVEAQWTSKHLNIAAFASTQNEYSLLEREFDKELHPAAQAYGLGILPFYPLAGGLLTGKVRRDAPPKPGTRLTLVQRYAEKVLNDRNMDKVEKLIAFAAARGHTVLELAMSWLAGRANVSSVIAGAMSAEQVKQNAVSIGWKLTAEELAEIDRITLG